MEAIKSVNNLIYSSSVCAGQDLWRYKYHDKPHNIFQCHEIDLNKPDGFLFKLNLGEGNRLYNLLLFEHNILLFGYN